MKPIIINSSSSVIAGSLYESEHVLGSLWEAKINYSKKTVLVPTILTNYKNGEKMGSGPNWFILDFWEFAQIY